MSEPKLDEIGGKVSEDDKRSENDELSTSKDITSGKSKETEPKKSAETKPESSAKAKETSKSAPKDKPKAGELANKPESKLTNSIDKSQITLIRPVTTYRGAGLKFKTMPFKGTITITGKEDKNGFIPVKFVRSGVGTCECFMLAQEVQRCKLSK